MMVSDSFYLYIGKELMVLIILYHGAEYGSFNVIHSLFSKTSNVFENSSFA